MGLFLTLDLLVAAAKMLFFNVVLFLTLGKAKKWYHPPRHIYICVVGSICGPHVGVFRVNKWSHFRDNKWSISEIAINLWFQRIFVNQVFRGGF